jgi:hypothetical protein
VRGVAITLDDSADAAAFQVLFEIKAKPARRMVDVSGKVREMSDFLEEPDKMLA